MYDESDILTASDLTGIEQTIAYLTLQVHDYGDSSIPTYVPKNWTATDSLIYTNLNRIETGIYNLGKYYYRPSGWQKKKTWQPKMSFSFLDVNRWLANNQLINERIWEESRTLLPRDDLYPSDTLLPR